MTTSPDSSRTQALVTKCESDHAAAILTLAEAEAAHDRADQAYKIALGQGRDAARAALRAQEDTKVDCDVARHAVEHLAGQLLAARKAAAAAEVERLTADALARINEFRIAATRELKSMTASARRLARLGAEADLAREAAIRAGVHEMDMPKVEDFRDVPPLPREVIETGRVNRWLHPFTLAPLSDEQTRQVSVSHGDAYLNGGGNPFRLSHQDVFDRVVYREFQRGECATSLMNTIVIPGLMADDVPGWSKPDHEGPHAMLAHLDALEGAPPPDRRDRRTRQVELVRVAEAERGTDPTQKGVASAA